MTINAAYMTHQEWIDRHVGGGLPEPDCTGTLEYTTNPGDLRESVACDECTFRVSFDRKPAPDSAYRDRLAR